MRETLTILIGNSDDKLTQAEWSQYVGDMQGLIDNWANQVHFAGFARPDAPWQNACWVVEWDTADLPTFNEELAELARAFRQDSIAIVVGGSTRFVRP